MHCVCLYTISLYIDSRLTVLAQVEFLLARPGFMKDFRGMWRVQPFTQHTLDTLYNSNKFPQTPSRNPWHTVSNTFQKCGSACAQCPY